MKKIIILILTICLCTACSKKQANNNNCELKMLSADMISNFSQSTDTGYYEISNLDFLENGNNIMYTDFQTNTKIHLCINNECLHNDDTCTAFVEGIGIKLFIANEKIFILTAEETDGTYQKKLYMADLNGENRQCIYEFNAEGGESLDYIYDDENIYFINTKAVQENNGINYQQFLVKINLSTKESVDLLNLSKIFNNSYVNILGTFKNNIIFKVISDKTEIKSIDIDGNIKDFENHNFDFENESYKYSGNYLYHVLYKDKIFTRKNLVTGKEDVIASTINQNSNFLNSGFGYAVDNNMFFTVSEIKMENNREYREEKLYYLDFEKSTIIPIDLYYKADGMIKPIVIIADAKDRLLVMNNLVNVEHFYKNPSKGIFSDIIPTPQYAMIAKEDFFNSNANYIDIE